MKNDKRGEVTSLLWSLCSVLAGKIWAYKIRPNRTSKQVCLTQPLNHVLHLFQKNPAVGEVGFQLDDAVVELPRHLPLLLHLLQQLAEAGGRAEDQSHHTHNPTALYLE